MLRASQRVRGTGRGALIANGRVNRFYNPKTKKYLHLSGVGEVTGTMFSWIGSSKQAKNLLVMMPQYRDRYVLIDMDDRPIGAKE